jgi:uncharacterized protein YbcI
VTTTEQQRLGEICGRISNEIVGIFSECYGRGPTKAKTYINDNHVFTVIEDIFTPVENTLVANGEGDLVRRVRVTFQEAVADRFKAAVAEATGRKVLTYHSQVTFDPPMGFEVFLLDQPPAL